MTANRGTVNDNAAVRSGSWAAWMVAVRPHSLLVAFSPVLVGATLGFAASSPEQAQAWHAAGLAAGGTAVEDPPGIREGKGMKLYLAYLRDPDGNKLCALHRM